MTKIRKEIPVTFGGKVSVGESVTNISVTVPRSTISLEDADENLCGRRITGTIRVTPKNVAEGQKSLKGMEDVENKISGAFDVKSIRVTPDSIKFGMSFDKNDVGSADLRGFVKQEGKLKIGAVAEIPEKGSDGEASEDDETEPAPKPNKRQKSFADDPGAMLPIADLVKHGLPKGKLAAVAKAAKGDQIGSLEALIAKGNGWTAKLAGFKPEDVARLTGSLLKLRAKTPHASPDELEPITAQHEIAEARVAGAEAARRGYKRETSYDAGTPEATAWLEAYDAMTTGTAAASA